MQTGSSEERAGGGRSLAIGLGVLGLGLGLAALSAPGALARVVGAPDDRRSRRLVRIVGLRELATGVGALAMPRSPAPLFGRLAGDVLDLALLGALLRSPGAARRRTAAAALSVAAVAVLGWFGARRLGAGAERGITGKKAITIRRSRSELYRFFRDFENLPRFLRHLESVRAVGENRTRWKARAPAGASVEWNAELVEDRPNERIGWRSVEGSEVETTGHVRFVPAPGGRGTEVHVEMRYRPALGKLGSTIAKLFREAPEQQIEEDLRVLKQLLETGEVAVSAATADRGGR